MHEKAVFQEGCVLLQEGEHIGRAVARVDLHGKGKGVGKFELRHKRRLLRLFVGIFVVIVEPDLPDRDTLRMAGKCFQLFEPIAG